jgi:sarcosine oxidase delta subunit
MFEKDKIYFPPKNTDRLKEKYHFKTTNEALKRNKNVKCHYEGCGKWFKVTPTKTGVDRDYCKKHREEIHEAEAEAFVEKIRQRELDETVNILVNEPYDDEIP